MVLLLGSETDPHVSVTRDHLRRRGTETFLIADSDGPADVELAWHPCRPEEEGFVGSKGRRIPLSAISGVLLRRRWQVELLMTAAQRANYVYAAEEMNATFIALFRSLKCPVINRPRTTLVEGPLLANPRLWQQLRPSGFALPKALVTSSPDRAVAQFDRWGQLAVVGSMWGTAPPRQITGKSGREQLQRISTTVYLFQVPPGEWLEVHVVGSQVLSSLWHPDAACRCIHRVEDRHSPCNPALSERCLRFAKLTGIDFLQLHLLRDPGGAFYCFDLTMFPSYVDLDADGQQKISAALADVLQG